MGFRRRVPDIFAPPRLTCPFFAKAPSRRHKAPWVLVVMNKLQSCLKHKIPFRPGPQFRLLLEQAEDR